MAYTVYKDIMDTIFSNLKTYTFNLQIKKAQQTQKQRKINKKKITGTS